MSKTEDGDKWELDDGTVSIEESCHGTRLTVADLKAMLKALTCEA